MKLNAPRFITWIVALCLGGLGILAALAVLPPTVPFVYAYKFWFVTAGFVLLLLASVFKGL